MNLTETISVVLLAALAGLLCLPAFWSVLSLAARIAF